MKSTLRSYGLLFAIYCLLTPTMRGQEEDPLKDPDFENALKEVSDLKKGGQSMPSTSDLKKQADKILAGQKVDEEKEKAELKKRLEKQMAEGPTKFPDWMPATPEFKATSSPEKKIVDDEVKLVQTGTSSLPPRQILAAWEAAVADKPLSHYNNDISVNDTVTTMIDISSRTDPIQKVVLEAKRGPDEKITQVTISSPMPKPKDTGE